MPEPTSAPTRLPFVAGLSQDPCEVLTAAVRDLCVVIDGARVAFAGGDTGAAEGLMGCAEGIRRDVLQWAGQALFYRAVGRRAEVPAQRRGHRYVPRHRQRDGHLRLLPAVAGSLRRVGGLAVASAVAECRFSGTGRTPGPSRPARCHWRGSRA